MENNSQEYTSSHVPDCKKGHETVLAWASIYKPPVLYCWPKADPLNIPLALLFIYQYSYKDILRRSVKSPAEIKLHNIWQPLLDHSTSWAGEDWLLLGQLSSFTHLFAPCYLQSIVYSQLVTPIASLNRSAVLCFCMFWGFLGYPGNYAQIFEGKNSRSEGLCWMKLQSSRWRWMPYSWPIKWCWHE